MIIQEVYLKIRYRHYRSRCRKYWFCVKTSLTSDRKQVNVKIPINRYSFFEELEGRILPPFQLTFEIELNPDAELLFGNVDTTRVTIDRFYLWVPKILPKDNLMTKYISEFQKPSRWKYLREKTFRFSCHQKCC